MESPRQICLSEYASDLIRIKALQLVGNYGFTLDDYEDLTQELWLDLLHRLHKYDASRAQLSTFITMIVDHRVAALIRYRTQQKRDYRNLYSLDEAIGSSDGSACLWEQVLSQDECDLRFGRYDRTEEERIDLSLDVQSAVDALPPDLKQLAILLTTESVAQAARELGIPRSSFYEREIASLREAFREGGLHEYL